MLIVFEEQANADPHVVQIISRTSTEENVPAQTNDSLAANGKERMKASIVCMLVFGMRLCGFIDEKSVTCTYLFLTMWIHKYRWASTCSVAQ
jgi:hypothetical protein